MRSTSMVNQEFAPSILQPFYFMRLGLLKGVIQFREYLHGSMLDFGCGSKPYRHIIQVSEYVGVDFENPGHPHDQEDIDVFYDGKSLPFADARFDSVLCSEVFEHVFNLDHILLELNRVLKPGGTVLITCPFVWNEHEVPYDFARYTRFALSDMLGKAGFEVVAFKKSGNFVSAITQMITLYFFHSFKGRWRKWLVLRVPYKFFGFLLPNLCGRALSSVLPHNDTMYLSNILVARKKPNVGVA